MFISEIWLFDWYFPQFCTSDMSKYGYLEVFQRVPSTSRYRESTVQPYLNGSNTFEIIRICSRQGKFKLMNVNHNARTGGVIRISSRFFLI